MKNIMIKLGVCVFGAAWGVCLLWFVVNLISWVAGYDSYSIWPLFFMIATFIGMGALLIEMDKLNKNTD